MSEQQLRKYMPGEEIRMRLRIYHASFLLEDVSARFVPEGPGAYLPDDAVYMRGRARPSEEPPPAGVDSTLRTSEAELSAIAEPELPDGPYMLDRVTVTTYGGREYKYSSAEFGRMADRLRFEIVEEPDRKPSWDMEFA